MAKIESISKFGFVADGKKYRYDEVSIDRALIVPGADVQLEGGTPVATMTAPTPAPDTDRAKRFVPKYEKKETSTSGGMSKDEWRLKDERISRQGIIQVCVQVMSDWDQAVELADKMLAYVNQNTPK